MTRDEKIEMVGEARERMIEAYRAYCDRGGISNLHAAAAHAAVMSALVADL